MLRTRSSSDAIRALPDGESKWRGLQTYSYGQECDASMEGVKEFGRLVKRGISVWIVSHKTEFVNFDPTVNLRAAALD